MTALTSLLLFAGAQALVLPSINIDSCVAVDPEEVRRLAAIEVSSWQGGSSLGSLKVSVSCDEGVQQLYLTRGQEELIASRTIDLSATEASDRDARTRELALAIAELLRRAPPQPPPQPAPTPTPPPPAPNPTPIEIAPPLEPSPWQLELGARATTASWAGGQWLYGADLGARAHFARWFIAELSLGGRRARSVELVDGSMSGLGVSGAAGLAFDTAPDVKWAGLAIGVRLGVDWVKYTALDGANFDAGARQGAAVNLLGSATAFAVIAPRLRLTLDTALGGALHSLIVEQNERSVSGLDGMVLSSSLGLALEF